MTPMGVLPTHQIPIMLALPEAVLREATCCQVRADVAGHLTQSLAYRVSVPVLLQLLYHFRRVHYTS